MEQSIDSPRDFSLDVDGVPSKAAETVNYSVKPDEYESTKASQSRPLKSIMFKECQNWKEPDNPEVRFCSVNADKGQPSAIEADLSLSEVSTPTGKKPSYLNLACCVNGYSSINTYDSRIRQELNKSREVSPIRPATTSVQCCKKINTLSPPLLVAVSNLSTSIASLSPISLIETNNLTQNDNNLKLHPLENNKKGKSIIQQRVERLYGPGALAQGFYSPKKIKEKIGSDFINKHFAEFNQNLTEDPRENCKSQQNSITNVESCALSEGLGKKPFDLPVLRHLSPEFRAQLPSISPKRNNARNIEQSSKNIGNKVSNECSLPQTALMSPITQGEIDQKAPQNMPSCISNNKSTLKDVASEDIEISKPSLETKIEIINKTENEKDGNYFLKLLQTEQNLLLALADEADKYIENISNDPEVSEEVLGILRAASGKARLFVSQKLKQFEGLCYNNINCSKDEKFPTTVEDLQGFWDMVYLQIANINLAFEEIDSLKKNNWKKTESKISPPKTSKQQLPLKRRPIKIKPTNVNGNISRPSSDISAAKREARRKQLDELKKKYKMAANSNSERNMENPSIVEPGTFKNEECS